MWFRFAASALALFVRLSNHSWCLAPAVQLLAGRDSFTSVPTAGELAVVAGIELLKDLEPLDKLLAAFPALAAFHGRHAAAAAEALAGLGTYFSRA